MNKKVTPVDAGKAKPVATAEAKQYKRDYAQKRFIVLMLAQHEPPSAIVTEVREKFGIELTRQMIAVYDPTKRSGRDLGKELRDLFFKERAAFLQTLENIPVSNKVVRMRLLNDAVFVFHEKGSYVAMAGLLEQAAKEVGDIFTNRREVTGKDGADIGVTVKHEPYVTKEQYSKMTPEERVEARNAVEVLYRIALSEGGERDE